MPMPNPLQRLLRSRLDYTKRVHIKRSVQAIDVKFAAAVIALGAAVLVAVRSI